MTEEMISVPKRIAQIVFDLAVTADSIASGVMDTEDITAMRQLAGILGVDPAVCTSDEFVAQFPHEYRAKRPSLDEYRRMVSEPRPDTAAAWRISIHRPETDAEVVARLGGYPEECAAWRCTKPADHPIHVIPETKEIKK